MIDINSVSGYKFYDHHLDQHNLLLLPVLLKILNKNNNLFNKNIFDLGCGNGSVANFLSKYNWQVTGVDPSTDGIEKAKKAYPNLKIEKGSAYENLSEKYGQFPILISLEVIEHLYAPRLFAKTAFDLLLPSGLAIISTPYHGYWKNLVLAILGKFDNHFHALWDHGHIKFWSKKTLSELLLEAGFVDIKFLNVGRLPFIAKSMIAIARKP
jgi:2-polyprenyl-6-hydroxyphenyl methylase/3-demethylubiquinone-9 3-methyltransferase